MERIRLPEISPRAWEHPADRAALTALKQVPGLDEVIRVVLGGTAERSFRLRFLASSLRVTPLQFPRLHGLVSEACAVLDLAERPELFVTQTPELNAMAVGWKQPFVVLNSSMLDTLDEDETLAVIAHEIAHIASGHMLYRTLLELLKEILKLGALLARIPVAPFVVFGVLVALLEWYRKSELSCDRASLLVVQKPEAAVSLLMKLAGGRHIEQMDQDEFHRQAEEYDSSGDIVDGIFKVLNLIGQTHPFPVLRVRSIGQWAAGDAYQSILAGSYPRRSDSEQDAAKDFAEAQRAYEEELRASKDPLAQAAANIGEGVENVRREAERFFGSLFGRK